MAPKRSGKGKKRTSGSLTFSLSFECFRLFLNAMFSTLASTCLGKACYLKAAFEIGDHMQTV